MSKCTRNFYEEPVAIRGTKLQAAKGGYDSVLGGLKAEGNSGKKVAIVGGGRLVLPVPHSCKKVEQTLPYLTKKEHFGGNGSQRDPVLRIDNEAIAKDVEIAKSIRSKSL